MVDENSRKLINGAVKDEDILNLNVSSTLALLYLREVAPWASPAKQHYFPRRYRANRPPTNVQPGYGRLIHFVAGVLDCRLPHGGLRGEKIPQSVFGVDFMLVGDTRTSVGLS